MFANMTDEAEVASFTSKVQNMSDAGESFASRVQGAVQDLMSQQTTKISGSSKSGTGVLREEVMGTLTPLSRSSDRFSDELLPNHPTIFYELL